MHQKAGPIAQPSLPAKNSFGCDLRNGQRRSLEQLRAVPVVIRGARKGLERLLLASSPDSLANCRSLRIVSGASRDCPFTVTIPGIGARDQKVRATRAPR